MLGFSLAGGFCDKCHRLIVCFICAYVDIAVRLMYCSDNGNVIVL